MGLKIGCGGVGGVIVIFNDSFNNIFNDNKKKVIKFKNEIPPEGR